MKLFFKACTLMAWLSSAQSSSLPAWITNSSLIDGKDQFVVCSHQSIDPEKAKLIAEDKCLESALKSGGVNFELDSKTVLTTKDSEQSDVYQVKPVRQQVRCVWTDQFIEVHKDSYRVWLKCRVLWVKGFLDEARLVVQELKGAEGGMIRLTLAPVPDKIMVENAHEGNRFCEADGGRVQIQLRAGDNYIQLSKIGYHTRTIDVSQFKKDSLEIFSVTLEKEM